MNLRLRRVRIATTTMQRMDYRGWRDEVEAVLAWHWPKGWTVNATVGELVFEGIRT